MENPTPDFPPFTPRQLEILEELKAEIEKLTDLSALDPEVPKINQHCPVRFLHTMVKDDAH